jgi:DNA repair exonuclease SbcCD nuclease subunit
MASFRFLHCADLHIDSPLRGLEADPDAPAARIRAATREAFVALIDFAIAQNVAFVLAAGDLYDGEWQDWRTGQFLIGQLGKLARATPPIPFIAIRGNHDAESIITRRLDLPTPAKMLNANRPDTVHLHDLGVRIHGQSFRTREVTDNLATAYPTPEPGMLNIGLLHTSVDGREGHASYAPCSVEQLRNHGYDYWALGHVHTREVLSQDPWIVFPGNTQGRHARETGSKGATIVTVQDGRITKVEPVIFDTVRWAQVRVELDPTADEDAALALTRAYLADALNAADGRLLAARILLTGATTAHTALNRDVGAIRAKICADALVLGGIGEIWIESVAVNVTPPGDRDEIPSWLAPEIARLTADELAAEAATYCRRLLDHAGPLRDALGPDHPAVAAARDELTTELVERARNLLLARYAENR